MTGPAAEDTRINRHLPKPGNARRFAVRSTPTTANRREGSVIASPSRIRQRRWISIHTANAFPGNVAAIQVSSQSTGPRRNCLRFGNSISTHGIDSIAASRSSTDAMLPMTHDFANSVALLREASQAMDKMARLLSLVEASIPPRYRKLELGVALARGWPGGRAA